MEFRFKNWGGPDPYRTAEDLAYAVARFFQRGGTFQNYYMVITKKKSDFFLQLVIKYFLFF